MSLLEIEIEIRDKVVLLTAAEGQDSSSEIPSIANTAWVVFPKGCPFFRTASEEWLRSEGTLNANLIEISTMEMMLNCVQAGLGFALVPESVISRADNQFYDLSGPKTVPVRDSRGWFAAKSNSAAKLSPHSRNAKAKLR